jgi:hypothetical protein
VLGVSDASLGGNVVCTCAICTCRCKIEFFAHERQKISISAEEVRRNEASNSKSRNQIPIQQAAFGAILNHSIQDSLAVASSGNAVAVGASLAFQSKEVS